jgi:hypothetical protein
MRDVVTSFYAGGEPLKRSRPDLAPSLQSPYSFAWFNPLTMGSFDATAASTASDGGIRFTKF